MRYTASDQSSRLLPKTNCTRTLVFVKLGRYFTSHVFLYKLQTWQMCTGLKHPILCCGLQSTTSTLEGSVALLLKGSGVEKGSIFVVFLKKSSEEALNGSVSLNGSPPKGSAAQMIKELWVNDRVTWEKYPLENHLKWQIFSPYCPTLLWRISKSQDIFQ